MQSVPLRSSEFSQDEIVYSTDYRFYRLIKINLFITTLIFTFLLLGVIFGYLEYSRVNLLLKDYIEDLIQDKDELLGFTRNITKCASKLHICGL